MAMEGLGTAEVTDNGYQYNGKEMNEDLGLNWSDYGARWYDAALGRWWAVDPLGEKQLSWSTYGYTMNNPIFFIDPNGMESEAAGPNFLEKYKRQQYDRDRAKGYVYSEYRGPEGNSQQTEQTYEKQATNKLPTAYYVNEANLTSVQITDIGIYAAEILSKNGYHGLRMEPVATTTAKMFNYTFPGQMFLAFIRTFNLAPGNSNEGPDGTIGVYYESNKGNKTQGWASYVNMDDEKIANHKGDKMYAAGFIVAHELTHQLIHIASWQEFKQVGGYYFKHNFSLNLMAEGNYLTPPNYSDSKNLRDEEVIPQRVRSLLDKYFLTPQTRLR